jgi:alkanesulfonate monooxygenase SsuD/methylene tetrahydromethanopterin reductase-like flavin-dependent oxidoreductase (luciferase family)
MEVWIRQSLAYYYRLDEPTPFPVPGWMYDRARGEDTYAERLRYLRRMDEAGIDGIIFTEHHYGPNGGLMPSPIVMMATAAGITERIKLITMGTALALYPHPVRLAEELAMIDNISHGRLVWGIISAGSQNLYAYNVPVEEERARHNDGYDLIIKAWTEENPFEWNSEFFHYPCVSILPRPVQVPHPPVWTTASAGETLQWAAHNRISLMAHGPVAEAAGTLDYYQSYAESECGWTPTPANRGIAREFFIAPTRAKLEEMVERSFSRRDPTAFTHRETHAGLRELERARAAIRSYDYRTVEGPIFRGADRTVHGMQTGQFIAGTPDTLIETILEQRKACDAGVLVIRPEMPNLSMDEVAEGMELFTREVLPAIRDA